MHPALTPAYDGVAGQSRARCPPCFLLETFVFSSEGGVRHGGFVPGYIVHIDIRATLAIREKYNDVPVQREWGDASSSQ
jgi:hypothetical protein